MKPHSHKEVMVKTKSFIREMSAFISVSFFMFHTHIVLFGLITEKQTGFEKVVEGKQKVKLK